MRVNEATLDLIKRFEGLRLKAYLDAAGVWTICYGHTSRAGPPKVKPGMKLTKVECDEILQRDIEKFADQVAKAIKPEILERLNENQFGALVSFAYNVGIGNLRRSSVLRAVNEGRFSDVPRLLMRWTKAGGKRLRGLVRRRRAEGRLWLTPVGGKRPPLPAIVRHKKDELATRPRLAAAWSAFLASLITLIAAFWREIMSWLGF